jgi:hypothetical protein
MLTASKCAFVITTGLSDSFLATGFATGFETGFATGFAMGFETGFVDGEWPRKVDSAEELAAKSRTAVATNSRGIMLSI